MIRVKLEPRYGECLLMTPEQASKFLTLISECEGITPRYDDEDEYHAVHQMEVSMFCVSKAYVQELRNRKVLGLEGAKKHD